MGEELLLKVKLIPDTGAIDKYLANMRKTSIAMKGTGGGGNNGGSSGGGGRKDIDDVLKKNLKIFKTDLLLRWIKRIWQITEKNIPLMNVLARMNNSLIRLFLFPIMMRVFKILLPIYRELFKMGQWWVTGGFEKILSNVLGGDGKGPSPAGMATKGVIATLGIDGIGKILAIIVGKIKDNILLSLSGVKAGIIAFVEKWGLDEIFLLIRDKLENILEKSGLGGITTKISIFFTKLLAPLERVFAAFNSLFAALGKVVGAVFGVINIISAMSLAGDIFDLFGRTMSSWLGDISPILKRFFDTMSVGGQFFSSTMGILVGALRDLWGIIVGGQRDFRNLMDSVNMSGQLLTNFGKFILGPLMPRAAGGPVSGGQSYVVGEKGPEIFTPGVGGNITPNNKIGGGGASIGNINITINATKIDSSNLNQIAKEISDKIYTDVRRRVTF